MLFIVVRVDDRNRIRFVKAGQEEEVAVLSEIVVDIVVANLHSGGRDNGDAITDSGRKFPAAPEESFVVHGEQRSVPPSSTLHGAERRSFTHRGSNRPSDKKPHDQENETSHRRFGRDPRCLHQPGGGDPTAPGERGSPPPAADTLAPGVAENASVLLDQCTICDTAGYSGPLELGEAQGLLLALNDEYHAEAMYQQVLDDYGEATRPFSNVIVAEQHHQTSLLDLFAGYELTVPDNPWPGTIEPLAALSDACTVAVEAEIVNATLYEFLYSTTERTDVIAVYERLQAASNDKHLPAFERCGGNSEMATAEPSRRGGPDRKGARWTG